MARVASLRAAQPYSCALSERGVSASDIAYKLRGNRCEGVFVAPIAGEVAMWPLGFHLADPVFPLDGPGNGPAHVPIRVWGIGGGTSVSVRLSSLDWRLHYHMDTNQVDAQGRYQWNTEVVRALPGHFESRNMAALACSNDCRADPATRFYPVTVGSPSPAGLIPTLVLQSSVALSQLSLIITRSGKKLPERIVGSDFEAHEPITLPLQGLLVPGDNEVILIGTDAAGERVASWWGTLVLPT
jgi:hypothetical protein